MTTGIDSLLNLDEVRGAAKRRLPRFLFDFIEGGVDGELCLRRNRAAFSNWTVLPRYLVDVSARSQSVQVFGREYAAPIGISPMGLAGLARPQADLMFAAAAAKRNIPYIMSSASNASIEKAARVAGSNVWFQVYPTTDERISQDMVRRAVDAGVTTLVVTIDVPVHANRERNRRNGFGRPLRLTPRIVFDALLHPNWLAGFVSTRGIPMMENWMPYAPPGASQAVVSDLYGSLTPAPAVQWQTLEELRRIWPHTLVVKGVLNPADAVQCASLGADGMIISNHGGRQLDMAPSPLQVLPAIRSAVGPAMTLMVDSGVRRGSDVILASALGATLALVGRPMLYGAAVHGEEGVLKVIDIMRREIDLTMGQAGICALNQLDGRSILGPEFGRALT